MGGRGSIDGNRVPWTEAAHFRFGSFSEAAAKAHHPSDLSHCHTFSRVLVHCDVPISSDLFVNVPETLNPHN